jgi:signal transduction histidine kinase/CheY-like chemotaxis protein
MATILYIDQDETAQKFMQMAVGKKHHMIAASDGPTAIQYCAIIQPDLVLLEAGLPDIYSYQLAARLKMFMPDTPILVITDTGPGQGEDQRWVADGFLNKPVTAKTLRKEIQAHLPSLINAPESVSALFPDDKIGQYFEAQIAALNQTNQRLASINAISALIGISLDLEHLTDEILAQIHKTIDFDRAILFLLKGDVLEVAASRGFSEYRQGRHVFSRDTGNFLWRVVDNKLPLIIRDASQSQPGEQTPELGPIESWLGVPLVHRDRVVGVLTLEKGEANAFADTDARFVFNLAYQIAIAVENVQLFEEWEKQSTRLKLINEVAREINTILDEDDLLQTLARTIFERLPYDRVAIFEVDASRLFLELKALFGNSQSYLQPGIYRQNINTGLLGEVAREGRPLLVNDTTQHDSFLTLEGLNVRSELVVPVFVNNQVAAVINVDRNASNSFSDQDLWTLSSLASQAATAMQNARLYRQVQSYSTQMERTVAARTQRLQAIKKISQVVSRGLAVDQLLIVVGQGISQVFAANTGDQVQVAVGLLDGADILLKTISHGNDQSYPQDRPYPQNEAVPLDAGETNSVVLRLEIDAVAPVKQVINQASPMILDNFYMDPLLAQPAPANSVMLAPLITGGKMIGLIKVECNHPAFFDESDLETLETLAFQVGSAIEHARLLQRTREIAVVEERTRLARDMHDGVAQNLAFLLLQVDGCLNMVEEGGKLEARLERVHSLLKQNIDELRRNIFDLRPVELEGKSIFAVLENFVAEFGRRWYLKTTCVVEGEPGDEISPEVESALYRILQEALSNARQHAQCNRLAVKLSATYKQWVSLEIEDNGCGFDLAKTEQNVNKQKGLGLVSMRERVNTVGGHLTIESNPGAGTRIFARLPLKGVLHG